MNGVPGVHWYSPGLVSCGQLKFRNGPTAPSVGSQGEDRRRRGLSHRDTLRLGLIVGDGGKGRGIVGFDACNACIDARLGDELKRELTDERDQHISCRRSNCGIRRSAWFRLHVERVRTRAAVDGIQGIVDGYVHHGVDTRFVEWVVERSYAGRSGGHASVCVPDGDCVGRNLTRPPKDEEKKE